MKPAFLLFAILLFALLAIAPAQPSPAPRIGSGSIQRDGFQLHYRTLGSGRPVVVLSGGPGFDVDYMVPVARELSPDFEMVLLEQRGTGRSRPPVISKETINLELLVADIEALRVALKQERLIILGHSWGGMLAMAYAAAHLERVEALVLVDAGGMDLGFSKAFADNIQSRLSPRDAIALKRADKGPDAVVRGLKVELVSYFYSRKAADEFASTMKLSSYHVDMQSALGPDLAAHYNLDAALANFSAPVLIIQGRQDPMPESVAIKTHEVLKNSKLVFLDRCGHFAWLEQPAEFYKDVREFLRQSDGSGVH